MTVRWLVSAAVIAVATGSATAAEPAPLHGAPLTGKTGLRLLVANVPPLLVDVDSGRVTRITGLPLRGRPVLSVLAVGKDAVVWLDRPSRGVPRAQIYVVRHHTTKATHLATAWGVAPSSDGQAVWLKSFADASHCTLRELWLDGHTRRRLQSVPCSTRLVDSGSGGLLVRGGSVVDPVSGRTVLRTGGIRAMAGRFALTGGMKSGLALSDLRTGRRWRLGRPSRVGGGVDQAAVAADGKLIALSFSDPTWQGGGTQVTDVWLLNPLTRRFQHLPDMPAAVSLKFTSFAWASGKELVMLAETAQHDVVATWRPGQRQLQLRRVRLPERNSGSDSFVVWSAR
ncbi:MAG TPA: hypothetical protein VFA44_08960 [Gaiellaceae bacterium]|nr:hypothetical protein [Gaiellaceae bacterium]